MHGADHGKAVLRLRVADRVSARQDRTGSADLLRGSGEDRAEHRGRKLLGEGGDGESEQRRTTHREHVVQRVRRRDSPECRRIVDERRKEIQREDDRTLVVELVDGRVVRRREPDEEVLRLHRDKALQQLLEARSRVLRSAAAADGQSGKCGHE